MRIVLMVIGALLTAFALEAKTFTTQQQALAGAFPAGASIARETRFLTPQQRDAAAKASGGAIDAQLIVRYVAKAGGRIVGYAYFDTHRVRTLPETVMVVLGPDQAVQRIEILSFSEPPEYFPKPRWIDQIRGRRLNDELALNRAIRPITGASLTGRAIVAASRRILALHQVIEGAAAK